MKNENFYKVVKEETFYLSKDYKAPAKGGGIRYSVIRGMYKRLVFDDGDIMWVQLNDGSSDYGGHSNIEFNTHSNDLEKWYQAHPLVKAENRDEKINDILDEE